MNVQWTQFPNLLTYNNSRRVDMYLESINQISLYLIYESKVNYIFLFQVAENKIIAFCSLN